MGKARILIYTGALIAILAIRIINSSSHTPEDHLGVTVNQTPFRKTAVDADFTFSIDIQGNCFSDTQPVTAEEILALIDTSGKNKSSTTVQLLINSKTPFSHVQKLTDFLRKNGIPRVSYAFKEPPKN